MISFVLAFIAIITLSIAGSLTPSMYMPVVQGESCNDISGCKGCPPSSPQQGIISKGYDNSDGKCFHGNK